VSRIPPTLDIDKSRCRLSLLNVKRILLLVSVLLKNVRPEDYFTAIEGYTLSIDGRPAEMAGQQ
jgi:hypothetical protein